MTNILRWLEVKAVDLVTRKGILAVYDLEEVREYKGVPVYAPSTEECREELFVEAYAFASGEGIFVAYKSYARDKKLMEHEYTHVQQLREWGLLFPTLYWWQNAVNGYEGNYFEIEAEEAESLA